MIDRLKALIKDDNLRSHYRSYLNLIRVVNNNYEHIDQLEKLTAVMRGGLTPYYKTHASAQDELCMLCGEIANNTFWNHYKKDDEEKYFGIEEAYKLLN